ncbi:hypothetical protein LY76DRAFT_586705 [Colletotrichum caudatum]|nr:hypothetical protein LY76DRAFT_586705 [Colletotrichum caudatum]
MNRSEQAHSNHLCPALGSCRRLNERKSTWLFPTFLPSLLTVKRASVYLPDPQHLAVEPHLGSFCIRPSRCIAQHQAKNQRPNPADHEAPVARSASLPQRSGLTGRATKILPWLGAAVIVFQDPWTKQPACA